MWNIVSGSLQTQALDQIFSDRRRRREKHRSKVVPVISSWPIIGLLVCAVIQVVLSDPSPTPIMTFPESGVYSLFPNEDLETGKRIRFEEDERRGDRFPGDPSYERNRFYPGDRDRFYPGDRSGERGDSFSGHRNSRVYFDEDRHRFRLNPGPFSSNNRFGNRPGPTLLQRPLSPLRPHYFPANDDRFNENRDRDQGFSPYPPVRPGYSESKLPPRRDDELPNRIHVFAPDSTTFGSGPSRGLGYGYSRNSGTARPATNFIETHGPGPDAFLNHDAYLEYHRKIALMRLNEMKRLDPNYNYGQKHLFTAKQPYEIDGLQPPTSAENATSYSPTKPTSTSETTTSAVKKNGKSSKEKNMKSSQANSNNSGETGGSGGEVEDSFNSNSDRRINENRQRLVATMSPRRTTTLNAELSSLMAQTSTRSSSPEPTRSAFVSAKAIHNHNHLDVPGQGFVPVIPLHLIGAESPRAIKSAAAAAASVSSSPSPTKAEKLELGTEVTQRPHSVSTGSFNSGPRPTHSASVALYTGHVGNANTNTASTVDPFTKLRQRITALNHQAKTVRQNSPTFVTLKSTSSEERSVRRTSMENLKTRTSPLMTQTMAPPTTMMTTPFITTTMPTTTTTTSPTTTTTVPTTTVRTRETTTTMPTTPFVTRVTTTPWTTRRVQTQATTRTSSSYPSILPFIDEEDEDDEDSDDGDFDSHDLENEFRLPKHQRRVQEQEVGPKLIFIESSEIEQQGNRSHDNPLDPKLIKVMRVKGKNGEEAFKSGTVSASTTKSNTASMILATANNLNSENVLRPEHSSFESSLPITGMGEAINVHVNKNHSLGGFFLPYKPSTEFNLPVKEMDKMKGIDIDKSQSQSSSVVEKVHAHISHCPKLYAPAEVICDVYIRERHGNPNPQLIVGWRRKFHNASQPDVLLALNKTLAYDEDDHKLSANGSAEDFHDKFNVTLAPGISPMLRSVLLIRSVTAPDCGNYQCEVFDGKATVKSETLLFLCH